MIDYMSIIETDKVIHTAKTDMMKLVVENECFNMSFDEFGKEIRSSDGLQPKQANLSCVHALNEPHLHEIHVVPRKHEADLFPQDYNTSSDVPCLFIHILCYSLSLYPFTERYAQPYFFPCLILQMVNTRTDAELAAAVQNALQTLLPQIRAEIREEFRTV
nr:hypothetical protein [Tanacetum cinerariifolium]